MSPLATAIVAWFEQNQRDLPWRRTADPYRVWLSEIILQQTQVAQGLPYYERFVKAFPTVFDLAQSPEERVLKLWQGLGYYSRARHLHHTAKTIVEKNNGNFPKSSDELKKLKGIGDYTAAAIASICYAEPVAVLDGNVFRLLSRYFGIDAPINSTKGRKIFKKLAQEQLDLADPGRYNQAAMEFGALHCKPKNPLCETCPLQTDCVAFQNGRIGELPVKLKKAKVRQRNLNYIVFVSDKRETIVQKRTGKGIWQNLYQFPLVETYRDVDKAALLKCAETKAMKLQAESLELFNEEPIKHQLSHQKLMVRFWIARCQTLPKRLPTTDFQPINRKEIENYPVPALIEKFLRAFDF